MMPDLTVMVPELEIDRKLLNIDISKKKCTGPGTHVLTGGGGSFHGDRNSAIKKQPLRGQGHAESKCLVEMSQADTKSFSHGASSASLGGEGGDLQ
jgi:hypothetical protein